MKKNKFITLATLTALSSTLVLGVAPAFAEEDFGLQAREVVTEGDIEFISPTGEEDDEPTVVIPPETEPEVEIPPTIPGSTGPLTIAFAPTLNFGQRTISAQNQNYSVLAETQYLVNDNLVKDEEGKIVSGDQVPYVSFAQVQDTRGINAGWDLHVRLTDFTADTQNGILTGAQISFSDGLIDYKGNNQDNAPETHDITLDAGGDSLPIMTAAETKGAGTSSVIWGEQSVLDAAFAAAQEDEANEENLVENDAIKLFVPAETATDAAAYNAKLHWTLTSVADNVVDSE